MIYKTLHRKLKIEQHDPTKIEGKLRYGQVSSSCSTSDTRRFTLVAHPMIFHEYGQDRIMTTTNGTYPWSFCDKTFRNRKPSHGGDRITFEVMTAT